MLAWIKKHWQSLMIGLVTIGFVIFMYGCEPKVKSLNHSGVFVTRAELQLELETVMTLAEIRVADLDRQQALRNLILQNALILAAGQPLNPVGILTAIAALYGIGQASNNVVKTVKNTVKKKAGNNGTG